MAKSPLGLMLRSNPRSASLSRSTRHAAHSSFKHSLKRSLARSSTLLTLGMTGGWVLSNLWLPVQAATMINNSGIQFEQDTTLDASFVESHGAYQSIFGVMDLETRERTPLLVETKNSDEAETIFKPSLRRNNIGTNIDFRGTPGGAVANSTAQYTFKANKRYVLYLESSYNGRPTGILYSDDVLNPNREQQVKFAGGADDLCSSGVMVNWDDTGSKLVRNREQQDRDFDDFVAQLKGTACAIGGGETPPVAAPAPATPGVGALPPVAVKGSRFLWEPLLLLGLLPFLGGGDHDQANPPSNVSTIIPPNPPNNPPNNPPTNPPINPSPNPSINPSPNPPKCPTGNCQAVPEPMTILGSGAAIAFGGLMQRRRKRKH